MTLRIVEYYFGGATPDVYIFSTMQTAEEFMREALMLFIGVSWMSLSMSQKKKIL